MPRELDPGCFSPYQLPRTIAGQAGTQVFFHEGGRAFCLYVVLGSHAGRAEVMPLVNQVVETLKIEN